MIFREAPAQGAPLLVTTFQDAIYGIDATTGGRRWVASHLGGALIRLAVTADRVYGLATHLTVLDYLTGRELWQVKDVCPDSSRSLLVDTDRLYVATGTTLRCFSLDGSELWRQDLPKHNAYGALAIPGQAVQADYDT